MTRSDLAVGTVAAFHVRVREMMWWRDDQEDYEVLERMDVGEASVVRTVDEVAVSEGGEEKEEDERKLGKKVEPCVHLLFPHLPLLDVAVDFICYGERTMPTAGYGYGEEPCTKAVSLNLNEAQAVLMLMRHGPEIARRRKVRVRQLGLRTSIPLITRCWGRSVLRYSTILWAEYSQRQEMWANLGDARWCERCHDHGQNESTSANEEAAPAPAPKFTGNGPAKTEDGRDVYFHERPARVAEGWCEEPWGVLFAQSSSGSFFVRGGRECECECGGADARGTFMGDDGR